MNEKTSTLIALGLIGIWSAVAWALPGDWTTHTSMREVKDVRIVGADVWGATTGGLLRYSFIDSSYTQYTNVDGLAGNQVLCIEDDGTGNIWFGTDGQGLSKFIVQTGQFLSPFVEFRGHRISSLYYHQDKLFVGMDSGISLFLPDKQPEPEIRETYHKLGGLAKDAAVLCMTVLDDTLWAGTEGGVAWAWLGSANLMDPDSWTSTPYPSQARSITRVDSVTYAAGERGVFRRTGQRAWLSCGLGVLAAHDLAYYEGSLYAAAKDGVYRLEGENSWDRITDELPGTVSTSTLFATEIFGLWMGTADGFLAYKEGAFSPVPRPSGPRWNAFTGIAVDEHTGTIWSATASIGDYAGKGAHAFDGQQWTDFLGDLSAYDPYATVVVAVELDREGRAWLGTWGGGLHIVNETTWVDVLNDTTSVLRDSDPLTPQHAFIVANAISRDPQGNMWVSNYGRGLAVIDNYPPTQQALYDFEEYNPSGAEFRAMAICTDSSGVRWVGTYDSGFFLLDDGGTPFEQGDERILSFTASSHKDLTSDKIRAVAVDGNGVLWVGTDSGLNAIQGTYSRATGTFSIHDWTVFTTYEGLTSNEIHAICVDTRNNKWIGTEKGLVKINPDGAVERVYTTFNSKLVDNSVRSLAMNASTGELWIGTARGLSKHQTYLGSGPSERPAITAYPQPFVLRGGEMTLKGVPDGSSVKIFTLGGELVKALLPGDIARDGPVWNGSNDSNWYVASGIYFYLVTTSQGQEIRGKIAVVNAVPH